MVVIWNIRDVVRGGQVRVLAKAHTDVDIARMRIAFFDDTRLADTITKSLYTKRFSSH